uniref:Uncharacterized protein n=1 Tax=Rhodnius prolixus TaxID=13249 RepID=T1H918_RHOPR
MLSRLEEWSDNLSIIPDTQYGFRKRRSCQHNCNNKELVVVNADALSRAVGAVGEQGKWTAAYNRGKREREFDIRQISIQGKFDEVGVQSVNTPSEGIVEPGSETVALGGFPGNISVKAARQVTVEPYVEQIVEAKRDWFAGFWTNLRRNYWHPEING